MNMSDQQGLETERAGAVAQAMHAFDDGRFRARLAELVAWRTVSEGGGDPRALHAFLDDEMRPWLERLGFDVVIRQNGAGHGGPFLIARREEHPDLPTVLTYGHGDVVRGDASAWAPGLDPWRLTERDGRWYGRGAADNKGQLLINLLALEAVQAARGHLGFNTVMLVEMGEEAHSPGLEEIVASERERLCADLLLASDGPRLAPELPTLFMGSRGVANFDLELELREGAHHSGNWGGVLASPAIVLTHALAAIAGPHGEVRVPGWRPAAIPPSIAEAVRSLPVGEGKGAPLIDAGWGEPGLSAGEKLFAWPSFEVLAFDCGDPDHPVNAIQPRARARCHLRFVPPLEPEGLVPALRAHLDACGFANVHVRRPVIRGATRMLPEHPLVRWAAASIHTTTGKAPAVLPNLGGSLPNDVFVDVLDIPTIWVPHSYAGCRQHGPNEHVLPEMMREALAIMAGLWWDLGEGLPPHVA